MTSSISAFFSAAHFLSDISFWRWAAGQKSFESSHCITRLDEFQLLHKTVEFHRIICFNIWAYLSLSGTHIPLLSDISCQLFGTDPASVILAACIAMKALCDFCWSSHFYSPSGTTVILKAQPLSSSSSRLQHMSGPRPCLPLQNPRNNTDEKLTKTSATLTNL